MQISSLQWKLEQERKAVNSRVYDLERKLDLLKQELVVAESALSLKDSELAAIKKDLKELEELREMKEVWILLFYLCSLLLLYNDNYRFNMQCVYSLFFNVKR